jgi:hypothetical protein
MDSLSKEGSNVDPKWKGIKKTSYISIYISLRQLPYSRLKHQPIAAA